MIALHQMKFRLKKTTRRIFVVSLQMLNVAYKTSGQKLGDFEQDIYTYGEMETCRFSTETFWRLVFSHEWFIIHLQRDEVELEMNSEPRV